MDSETVTSASASPPNRPLLPLDQKCAGHSRRDNVPITLQSTVGGFSAEFMRKLPGIERAMIAHGLEPSQFVISKDSATAPTVPFVGPFFHDYTVFVGEEHFTITEPNDVQFLDYFYRRCVAEDEAAPRRGPAGLISRIFRWMAQPI
jgi:hypothetical protein